ncbi:DUF58 domain-containing protein [Candidatus Entotheonella palauensis]|uniref:Uncharacterized protein n=1 Tax=Candidatus Entotheonella gemina TaxID=1429439 RepID=W4MFM8_9BACT|nr:DUF58 domain-containing protein [Candidatus Entotheonella palauensis]ETX08985.1 MAG: hypothetical protein ETSY2_02180 [Candidatus Entotheonella gemina]
MNVPHLRVLRFFFTRRLTPAGRSLFVIWLIAALQGSVSLDIPIYHIWSFTTVCLALAWLSSLMAVPKIQLMRRQPQPAMVGTTLTYDIEIENRSRRAIYALSVMETEIPAGLQLARDTSSPVIDRLAPHAKMTLSLQLRGTKRGHHKLSGLYAASSYPLGLCRSLSFQPQEACATVYPAYSVPASFQLPLRPSVTHSNRGMANSHATADVSPDFAYIREYRHGDNPRHLHWASWARTGMPAIKVYQEEIGPRVGWVLDTAVQNPRDMHAFESGISAIAGISAYLLNEGIEIDCFVTESLLCRFSNDAPNRRFTHLMHTLAGLQASASVAWPAVTARLIEQAPACNTVALIALDWSREIAGFAAQLQHRGIGVRTLVIRHGPTSQPLPPAEAASQLLPGNPWPQEKSLSPWSGP